MKTTVILGITLFCATLASAQIPMIFVKGGTFRPQNHDSEGANPLPYKVAVASFYMSETEVTQAQYQLVTGTNPSYFQDCPDCPVERVSWYDAVEFCNALSVKEGLTPVYTLDKQQADPQNEASSDTLKWSVRCDGAANGYRLPTEAEWEFAAQGGKRSKGYLYAGSNDWSDVAWTGSNSEGKTHPVKSKKPNELGIYDLSGNVFEWCWDWHDRFPERLPANPRGAEKGAQRVLRSSSWFIDRAYYSLVGLRSNAYPYTRDETYGLRLVRKG